MNDNKINEFNINGIHYKCRTCFDPGPQVYSLTDKYSDSKTWRHLLNDVAQLKVSDDEFLPNTICCKCLDKLVSYKDFLLQVENVSKKYFELITNCKNNTKDTAPTNVDNVKCLAESATALPLEQFVTEIKLEDERVVPYDIVWADASLSQEDVNKSFKKTCKENMKGEELQIQQRSVKEEVSDLLKADPDETSSSSSDENDCLPEKWKKTAGDGNKSSKSPQYAEQENKNICKSIKKNVKCNTCKRSFSSLSYLRQHISTVHPRCFIKKYFTKQIFRQFFQQICKGGILFTRKNFTSSSEDEDLLPVSESFEKKNVKEHPDLCKITQVGKRFICPVCKKSFTLQRNCRRHVSTIHCPTKNMFACAFCNHIASCKEYLKAHIKLRHRGESFKSNIKLIIYRFGDCIYSKPSAWRLVECKLCNTKFVTTKQLRQHLQNHSDISTLDNLELESNIVQRWFPGVNLISVKAIISKNIREEDWFRYYTVLNEFWFELSISDTEEEDLEEDQLAERQRKYNCELCAKDFSFKYQIYAHLKEEHSKNEIPFKCRSCKLEFVSLNMSEQHKQIHCRNEYKNFQCSYCPGKFFSKYNMKNHYCVRQMPNADSDTKIVRKSSSLQIKYEDERAVPYDVVGEDVSLSQEDVNDPFEDNMEGEESQIQQRSLSVENDLFKSDLDETSSSEENDDCLPKKWKKKGDGNKNSKSSHYAQRENRKVCKSNDKNVKCNTCNRSFSSLSYLRQHIRTIHSSEFSEKKNATNHQDLPKITQVDKQFICPVCKKSFAFKKNCLRHMLTIHGSKKNMFPCGFCDHIASCEVYLKAHFKRMHPGESFKSNINQIIYRFGDRIYCKPSPWRLVECKLCRSKFIRTKQLRQHLQNYSDPCTLDSLELNSSIVQRWFPGMDLISVKATISKDIREKNWFKYYTVLNEFLFELSISDTEEEDLEDDDLAERQRKYKCELCAKDFPFKYQIFAHLKAEHSKHEIPFKCCTCKLEFVSLIMYEQHKEIHCRNEYKNIQCSYCPGKFSSEHNMKNHYCVRQMPNADSDSEIAGKSSSLHIMKTLSDPNGKSLNQNLIENIKHDTLKPIKNILDSDPDQEHNDAFLQDSKNQKLFETLNDASFIPFEPQQNICSESFLNYKNQELLDENQISSNKLSAAKLQRNHTELKVEIQNQEQTPLNDNTWKTFNSFSRMSENIIRCGFCALSFKNLKDLRQHMPLHSDGETSINFDDCLYVKQFESSKIIDYAELEQQIRNAYIKHQISRFYQAIDKYGNELDISDSDSNEDDDDDGEIVKKNYMCDVCKEKFTKRKRLLKHQQERHKEDLMPFTCQDCKMQYVSIHLLQQHLKRDCWNEHRRIAEQCSDCKARIIWPCNMLMHKEIQHHVKTELSNIVGTQLSTTKTLPDAMVNIRYCYLCPKTFYGIDQLNDHLSRHRLKPSAIKTVECIVHSTCWPNGKKIIKCKICSLQFASMVELKHHFSPNNLSSKCAGQHSLANYSITNQKGFELHLELDSETESESDTQPKHEKASADLEPYKCQMCNTTFKRKYQISQHQRSMHNYDMLELRCECCVFRTVSQRVLDYHRATQCRNVEKKHHCRQCNFRFMWKETLVNHLSIFHTPTDSKKVIADKSKITDQENNLRFNKTGRLSCQNIGHKGEKPFKCKLCEMTFTRNADLEDHSLQHTDEMPFKCTMCDRSFKRETLLNNHIRLHNNECPYKCNICSASFIKSAQLNRHLLGHSGAKANKFDNCGKGYSASVDLKKHCDKDGPKNQHLPSSYRHDKKTKQLCPICGKYISRSSLRFHIKIHMEDKPHKCDICGQTYVKKYSLVVHRRTHFVDRPFKCKQCKKSFVSQYILNYHMPIHTGERPYECNICQKKFSRKAYLKVHKLNHTGEKPFRCGVCGQRFKCRPYLLKHLKRSGHRNEDN